MTVPTGRLGPTVLVAAIALVCGACSSSDDAPAASATTSTTESVAASTSSPATASASRAPAPGDCIEPLTQTMTSSVQLPAIVSCDDPHGGEVVSVLEVPTPADGSYPAWSGRIDGVNEQIDECSGTAGAVGDLAEFLGSTPLVLSDDATAAGATDAYVVSGIQYALFVPGPAAWAAGDRWLACAAVLSNSLRVPSSYTGSLKGALAKPGDLDVQLSWCKQQPPDSRGTFTVVPCSEPHNYEQLASFTAGADEAPYPGDEALASLSGDACPLLSSQATAAASDDLPDGIGLGWSYPLESEWTSGDHAVRCFAVSEESATVGRVGDRTAKAVDG